ncbi:MAG: hypothetical protein H8E94_08015 [Alphaproteobacteria bacterium]|nr:hypothetical protein [Alphaproteobacteria bacterium]
MLKSALPLAKTFLVAAVTMVALSSCYLPVRFDAEIEIDRAGYYSMIFDGYLAHVPLYQDVVGKKITREQEMERVARLKTDFMRDSASKAFKYHKQGVFNVHWEKKGDLLRHKMVTFVRRNQVILALKYVKTKRLITVSAGGMSQVQRQRILDAGLNMMGEIRVITDARVIKSNATFKKKMKDNPAKIMYVWKIENIMSPSPSMVIAPG